MSLQKRFSLIGENKLRMELRAEAFNSTNTPHFSTPNGNASSNTFGLVHGTQDLAREGIDQRQLELSLRFSF